MIAMNEVSFQDQPPLTARVNAYDEQHLAIYLRLLMAEEEGADWREVVQVIFGLDPAREPDRAKIVHDSHLARARWMTEAGYRYLLEPRMQ
ncbi:putative SprT family Zn-dependent metalloprotease [Bradyrhizobium sp. USDA 328]